MIKNCIFRTKGPLEDISSDLLATIQEECPRLRGQPVSHPQLGIMAHTILFPEEVFKGPRRVDDIFDFDQEYAVLAHIKGKVPFVPQLTHSGQEAVFFGMKRLPGVLLLRNFFDPLTDLEKDGLATSIAEFIHGFAAAFSEEDRKRIVKRKPGTLSRAATTLRSLSNPLVKEYLGNDLNGVKKMMRIYLPRIASAKEGVILHQDLNGGNILVDPETKKLTGIIDFGAVCYRPIEEGFGTLHQCFPGSFVRRIADNYAVLGGKKIDYGDIILCDMASALRNLYSHLIRGEQNHVERCHRNILNCLDEVSISGQPLFAPRPHNGKILQYV